jgi:hypothetical protein
VLLPSRSLRALAEDAWLIENRAQTSENLLQMPSAAAAAAAAVWSRQGRRAGPRLAAASLLLLLLLAVLQKPSEGQNATKTGTFFNGCTLSYYGICKNHTDARAFCQSRGGELATYMNPTGLVGACTHNRETRPGRR